MRTAGNRRKLLDCSAGQWVELVAHAGRIASIDTITAPAATKVATW